MPDDLLVQFRLPAAYVKKLKTLAELHVTSPNLAARKLVIESLESTFKEDLIGHIGALHEELTAMRAAQREQAEKLTRFHAEFTAALRKTVEKQRG